MAARGRPVRASNIAIGTPSFRRSAFSMKSNGSRWASSKSSPPTAAAVPAFSRYSPGCLTFQRLRTCWLAPSVSFACAPAPIPR